ncbi:glutaredoxin 3 [Alysiella filiformis]|uniref:Glutaredoxin n=1 Tax=Alysiella filiformis DSM 16848 TaxID=1120981 RepID=A0A286E790_9NEIS|nr:glutaredoxin 3 [Alysiella filiformis]QMT31588.1 glutaredoxin 3 [Alysiella filiformis]UBQ55400.1 glutaredoxin 3 [Alysiella filiformis DSM 16848]SOD66777.1 glutaredoxin 3 [Alysiella filiformis DSM 16848]
MAHVKMYIKPYCPYCAKAQQLLSELGVQNVEIIRVDNSDELFQEMKNLSGRHTVPQIFIGSTHVGGFTDMYALHQQGGLQVLLNQE